MLENEFPGLKKGTVYLDSACSALKMKSAINAFKEVCEWGGCGGKRTTHLISRMVEEYYEDARKEISQFIKSEPSEIVFTSGTTDGFNKIASWLNIKPCSEIIISALEHNSVFLPFYEKAKREKLKLSIIPLKDYSPDINAFEKMISEKTAAVCLTMASNIFGGTVNITDFIELTRKRNPQALIILDAAQYITSHKVDVKKTDCDVLCFSGHKLGSPYGIGVMYIKKDIMKRLDVKQRGGGTVKEVKLKRNNEIEVRYLEGYQGMEAGIQNYASAYALSLTIRKLNETRYEKIREHISSNVKYAIQKLSRFSHIKLIGKNHEDGSIVSFIPLIKKFSPKSFEIFSSLSKPPIAFRTGRMCADLACIHSGIKSAIRISFFVYNSKKDVDIFVKTLEDYIKKL